MSSLFGTSSEKEEAIDIEKEDAFLKKWSGPMLVGPLIPAFYFLIIIFFGNIVLNTASLNCAYPLESSLQAAIVFSYLFLIGYSWVFLGFRLEIRIPIHGKRVWEKIVVFLSFSLSLCRSTC